MASIPFSSFITNNKEHSLNTGVLEGDLTKKGFSKRETPITGHYYQIIPGDNLLKVAGKAYQASAGAVRLKFAQKINAHPKNRKFWVDSKSDFAKKYFPDGIISFKPRFTCGTNQVIAQKRDKKCYANIWIPEITEDPITPKPKPPRPVPPSPTPTPTPVPFKGKPRVIFMAGLMGSQLAINRPNKKLDFIWAPSKVAVDFFDLKRNGNGFNNGGTVKAVGIIKFEKIYEAIIQKLKIHSDLLEFPYDWRLSNATNAKRLHKAIRKKWPNINNAKPEEKVTIIAHSMGGLLVRYYIEHLKGYRTVKKMIAVGTPHLGAPEALFGIRLISKVKQKLLLNRYASIIELLPTYDFVQLSNGKQQDIRTTYDILEKKLKKGIRVLSSLRNFMKIKGITINDLINIFRRGLFKDVDKLNDWLGKRKVKYIFVGSNGIKTIQGFNNKSKRKIFDKNGDGTVPFKSAMWFSRKGNQQNILRKAFKKIEHRDMLKHPQIVKLCVSLIKETRKKN